MNRLFVFVAFLVLVGCGSKTGSNQSKALVSDESTPTEVADSIYVGQVGSVSVADAYHRLRNYRRLLGDEIYGNEIVYYVNALVRSKPPGVADSLVAIAEDSPPVSADAIAGAIELRSSKVGPWVERHADELGSTSWMIVTAAVQRAEWRDSTVMRVLMEQALHSEDGDVRAPVTRAFNGIGTLDEVRTLAALADTTVDESVRERALGTLLRFDVPAFNQKVRSLIDTARTLNIHLRLNMERHRRYDFLPELRAIQDRLPPSVSAHSRRQLRKLIAYLEDKKAEGAPLGVPLDWPETTWEELEREGSGTGGD